VAHGSAPCPVALAALPASTGPLQADIVVRMSEAGGRAVERKLSLPIAPATTMIGVKPLFGGRSLGEGETANFDVIVVSPDSKLQSRTGLRYELLKIDRPYQWYRHEPPWPSEPIQPTQ